MRARHQQGSVVYDRRRKTWNYLWCEDGKRRSKLIGTKSEYPTKSKAWEAAELIRPALATKISTNVPTVAALVEQYRREKMPQRFSTRRSYECWISGHILPRWGTCPLTDLQARPVELWLTSLDLSPKSRAHVRGLISTLWDFAMWNGSIPTTRNPIDLVTVKGVSKRTRQPRSLTVEEFQTFVQHLSEPFRTIALVCVCLGLRISECLALRWADVDWLGSTLAVERGIVRGAVDDVKTAGSHAHVSIDRELLRVLQQWKQSSQFSADEDWIFASPCKLGNLPWSYPHILRVFHKAATAAGVGDVATHTMRHSYRSWLDSVGTAVGVQQKMMRHASITTTMDIYGGAATADMIEANGKIAGMALSDGGSDRVFAK